MSEKFVIRNLNKTFVMQGKPSIEALRGIDLTIAEGEFVSIVGASGSGKSTLLRIIDGLESATSGTVLVDGRQVTRPGRDRAMVFQQDSLLPWRTVLDNVAYGLLLAGTARAEATAAAQRFVDLTGLGGFERHYPHQLSGGMRQRVNVARALAMNPEILLLDEPFAALDAQTREIMQSELLKIWQAQQKTVLFITHQIDEAVYLSDRVVVFSARPGTVREEIAVPFARPRELSLKRTEQFGRIVDRIWGHIEGEVRRSMGLETRAA
jgi:ABC-type nitrate/sulfonate/bicarbonate transport system ATPase subunit